MTSLGARAGTGESESRSGAGRVEPGEVVHRHQRLLVVVSENTLLSFDGFDEESFGLFLAPLAKVQRCEVA